MDHGQNEDRHRSVLRDRTTTHVGYEKHRGRDRVGWMFTVTQAAYNLVRMRNLPCPT